jgi:carboxyl-terminal processing protease
MLTRFLLVVLACFAATNAAAGTDYPALFEATWSTVNSNFYDPGFHGVDWKAVGARYRAKLGQVKNDKDFEQLTSAMLKDLGTSHIYIVPPKDSSASGVGIGVRFRELGGENLVSEVAPLSDAGVRIGERLLSPRGALSGPAGSIASARFQGCDGKVHGISAHRIGAFWPPTHPGFSWSITKLAAGHSIGYLRIDRFDDGAALLADQAMAALKDTDGLIIDIRANSGGNASALRLQSYFAPGAAPGFALFARPYLQALGRPVTKADVLGAAKVTGAYTDEGIFAAVSSNKGAASFWSEDMGDKRYTKPVVVLTGEGTASAAEGFAWTMRALPQVKFVGRKTEGALLSAQDFALPGGWSLTIPVQGVWGPDGLDYRDRAVVPDVQVNWTRAEMCTGRDPDIAAALKLL